MSDIREESPSKEVKVLTESEIQERLYGGYLGKSQRTAVSQAPLQRPVAQKSPSKSVVVADRPDVVWTGAEILKGELSQLRSELVSLRRERENLQSRLKRLSTPSVSGRENLPGVWMRKLTAFVLLAGLLWLPLSSRGLQASPAAGDLTPYTVQVGVYDVQPMAQRAVSYLKGLGYDAFLVGLRRRNGRKRYRIYVGSFVTDEEASLERSRLASDVRFQSFKDAFVRIY